MNIKSALLISIGLMSSSVNAMDFAKINMNNGNTVYLTSVACDGNTSAYGYVVSRDDVYLSDVCWLLSKDFVIVVTPDKEVAKFNKGDLIQTRQFGKKI